MSDERLPLGAVYVALFLLGAVVGVWGVFLVPFRLPGGVEGLADLVAVVGTLGLGLLAAWALRAPPAAAMPGFGWVVSVMVFLLVARPSDEVIIPGKLPSDPGVAVVGTVFLLAGLVGTILAVVLAGRFTPSRPAPTPQR